MNLRHKLRSAATRDLDGIIAVHPADMNALRHGRFV